MYNDLLSCFKWHILNISKGLTVTRNVHQQSTLKEYLSEENCESFGPLANISLDQYGVYIIKDNAAWNFLYKP